LLNKIIQIFHKERQIVRNFSFLTLIQVLNAAVPLITTPYILRVIGTDNFGKITACQAVFVFLITVCEFGFNITGARDVAIQKNDAAALSRTFSEVMTTKIWLLGVALVIFSSVVFYVPAARSEWLLYLTTLPLLFGNAFDPLWFFIGAEEMSFLAYANLINKAVYLASIFLFIRVETDYIWINGIFGISAIVSFLIGYIYLFRRFKPNFVWQPFKVVLSRVSSNFPFFTSSFALQICASANVLILKSFQTDYQVGIFGIVQRIISVARLVLTSFASAVYARVCNAVSRGDKAAVNSLFRNAYLPFMGLLLVGTIAAYFLSPFAIHFFMGKSDVNAISLLRGHLLLPLVVALNIPATLFIQALDRRRLYSMLVIVAAVSSLLLNWFLTRSFDMWGTMWGTIGAEGVLLIGVCIGAWRIKNAFLKNLG
jgi:polysaccharide transporter, PST family